MFIVNPKINETQRVVLDKTKEIFGVIPPHWELFAKLHPLRFEMFMKEIGYLLNHPHIHPDFFAFMRFYIANKEGYAYCKSFNTKLLLTKGYDKKDLKSFKEDIAFLPLDEKHRLLARKVEKALYQAAEFGEDDIAELKAISWSDADIYDAIDHGAFLFKFSRILKAYLV